jgi:hypothetical protein
LVTLWVSAHTAQNNLEQRECHSLIVNYDVFTPAWSVNAEAPAF